MGIVCHCPQGHRVKVKDHLAGKRGLCPTCGASMRIPAPLPAGARLTGDPQASGAEPQLPLAQFLTLDPVVIATLPRALPFGTARATTAVLDEPDAETPQAAEPDADVVLVELLPEAPAPFHARIADRPDLSWRIAYPGGTASEPVEAATLQDWLSGGQAEGTELVWRTDWRDWLPVRDVFPEFFHRSPAGEAEPFFRR